MPRVEDYGSADYVYTAVPKKSKSKIIIVVAATVLMILLVIALVVVLVASTDQVQQQPDYLHYYPPKNAILGIYQRAAVATDHQVCSDIGRDILQQNGSAVDAAIAAVLCVGVMNPAGSGIGGGSFTLIYNKKERKVYGVDSRETAPLASNSTMYVNLTGASNHGNMAIGVPGEIAGYYAMWKKFGRLPWHKLFEPSIKLCNDGMLVSRPLAESIQLMAKLIRQFKNLNRTYVNPTTNQTLKEGDFRRDEQLGRTLQRISDNPFEFYNGSLAREIIEDACEDSGTFPCILSLADLEVYVPRERKTVTLTLNSGHTVHMLPPPSSSAIIGFFLNGFEKYGLSTADFSSFDSTMRFYQRQTEISKFAFAERTLLGDEDFDNFTLAIERLLSKSYAADIISRINDTATYLNSSYYQPPQSPGSFVKSDGGTSHVSVIDADGNAVSTTSTINTRFGSLIKGSKTGIYFNNEMDDFSTPGESNGYDLPPGPFNFPEPMKRPLSSMAPLILLDPNGDVSIVTGASGGPLILSGTVETLLRVLFLKDDLKQATDAPRLHHQYLPNVLQYEPDVPSDFRAKLQSFGHVLKQNTALGGIGIVQSIYVRPDKKIEAYSDPRKYSGTAGY